MTENEHETLRERSDRLQEHSKDLSRKSDALRRGEPEMPAVSRDRPAEAAADAEIEREMGESRSEDRVRRSPRRQGRVDD